MIDTCLVTCMADTYSYQPGEINPRSRKHGASLVAMLVKLGLRS